VYQITPSLVVDQLTAVGKLDDALAAILREVHSK
jgi:hypothetical protein